MSAIYARLSSDAAKDKTQRGHNDLRAHVSSWDRGVRVEAYRNEAGVSFNVYETGGSNDPGKEKLICQI
jgi:hypothetical protein